ncbi:MAG: MFS transporter [Betaproteobacteria bacterium]|nr:MFS transporter [Betaproteobacteria bacterium]MBI3935746.1 MFS transporter [Betaproteobacteria bacterium]
MEMQRRNVLVLSGCQATLQTTGTTMIAVAGLAGFALASDKSLATVPLTFYVLGAAVATIPASLLMNAIGRRGGFQVGTLLGMCGAAVCSVAIYLASFWLLCAGMTVLGMYTAFGKYYRFAAADAARVEFRAKAISLTLAGGIVGGVFGPEMAKRTTELFPGHIYLGSYLSLILVCLLAALLLTRLDIPRLSEHERRDPGRPLAAIMRQPVFIVAALASMLSYGIMNLFMTSTPLAMRAHDYHFDDAAFVLQWHMIGMYGPSFFTGSLVQRFGALNVILAGIVLLFVCILSALAGTGILNFWVALFLLGVGWNFMYVGGSALLTECHTPAERAKTQAANDFMIFVTMAVSSASSGVLLNKSGWHAVNYGSLPFLVLAAAATLWLMWQRRAARRVAPQPVSE